MFYGIVFNHMLVLICVILCNRLLISGDSMGQNRFGLKLKLVKLLSRTYFLSFPSKICKENSLPSNTP